jgi:Putative Actinobacterial Holin-X, holin superfamily III
MAYQAAVNGGPGHHRSEGVITSLGELGGNVATLAELQAKLTLIDAREAVGRATWPTAVLAVSAAVLLATVPVLLIGLAFLVASWTGISQGAALLIVAAVVAIIAGAIALVSLREFLRSFESFRRSRDELTRNVAWIKTVLTQSAKSGRR